MKHLKLAAIALSFSFLAGCATSGNPIDPYEGFNRSSYEITDAVDKAVLRPVAVTYQEWTPRPIRNSFSRFFGNLAEPLTIINDLLQFKLVQGASDTGRFLVNSSIGILGLFDPASDLGLTKHNEDFGQTFAYWGYENSSFLFIPLLGPSTVRDGLGTVTGFALQTDPVSHISDTVPRVSTQVVRTVDLRGKLIAQESLLEGAIDPYLLLRDAWLQQRVFSIYDGDVPEDDDDEAWLDDESDEELEALGQ